MMASLLAARYGLHDAITTGLAVGGASVAAAAAGTLFKPVRDRITLWLRRIAPLPVAVMFFIFLILALFGSFEVFSALESGVVRLCSGGGHCITASFADNPASYRLHLSILTACTAMLFLLLAMCVALLIKLWLRFHASRGHTG